MRWLLGLLGLLLAGVALTYGIQIGNLRGEVGQARAQLAAQQHADRQAQAQMAGELATERAAFAQAEARIGGTHRDLITCADWQALFLPVSGVDSFNGQLSASAGPPTLPQHCVNQ